MDIILDENNIELKVRAKDWREAVKKSGAILARNGYVEERYINAMVETVKELGPYIVVAPGLALPHAKRSDGVIKSGISIITLDEPIEFGNSANDPVYVLIGLSGSNDQAHLQILQAIASVFEDEKLVYKIAESNCKKEIVAIFNGIEVRDDA